MIRAAELFSHMGLDPDLTDGGGMDVRTPIDGSLIGSVMDADPIQWEESVGLAERAYDRWRDVPAPQRGDLVRRYGEVLRHHKDALGRLVSLEAGKILQRGPGRGPGDDRHLRLRRRAVAPALRPDHRVRAAGPPPDGGVAPASVPSPSSPPSTSPSRSGRGTRRSASSAATPSSGSRPRRRRSPRWPARRCCASSSTTIPCSTVWPRSSWVTTTSGRRWPTTSASRSSAPPGARGWDASSVLASRPASGGRCSSSAATTP